MQIAREVLAEAGLDPDLVTLAVEERGDGIAATLATHPDVRIVDFTGSSEFGNWLEANARQAVVYTEKAGLNTVVVDSTDDYKGLLRNLSFSLSLYSGQMCTTPQNILVPPDGIETDAGHRSADEFAADLAGALDKLLGDPKRAAGTLGAIVNDGVLARLAEASGALRAWCRPTGRGGRRAVARTRRSAPRWSSGSTRRTRRSTPASGSVRSRSSSPPTSTRHSLRPLRRDGPAPRRADRLGVLVVARGHRGRTRRPLWTPACTCRRT